MDITLPDGFNSKNPVYTHPKKLEALYQLIELAEKKALFEKSIRTLDEINLWIKDEIKEVLSAEDENTKREELGDVLFLLLLKMKFRTGRCNNDILASFNTNKNNNGDSIFERYIDRLSIEDLQKTFEKFYKRNSFLFDKKFVEEMGFISKTDKRVALAHFHYRQKFEQNLQNNRTKNVRYGNAKDFLTMRYFPSKNGQKFNLTHFVTEKLFEEGIDEDIIYDLLDQLNYCEMMDDPDLYAFIKAYMSEGYNVIEGIIFYSMYFRRTKVSKLREILLKVKGIEDECLLNFLSSQTEPSYYLFYKILKSDLKGDIKKEDFTEEEQDLYNQVNNSLEKTINKVILLIFKHKIFSDNKNLIQSMAIRYLTENNGEIYHLLRNGGAGIEEILDLYLYEEELLDEYFWLTEYYYEMIVLRKREDMLGVGSKITTDQYYNQAKANLQSKPKLQVLSYDLDLLEKRYKEIMGEFDKNRMGDNN